MALIIYLFLIMLGTLFFYVTFLGPVEEAGLISVTITPTIYSSTHNIGVLNEMAIFEMGIWNGEMAPQYLEIAVTADEELILSETWRIDADSSGNVTITQRLSDIGIWKVKAIHNQKTLDSYSFGTLINKEEADAKIGGYPPKLPIELILGIGTLILGIISVIISYLRHKKG